MRGKVFEKPFELGALMRRIVYRSRRSETTDDENGKFASARRAVRAIARAKGAKFFSPKKSIELLAISRSVA
jgi:hypothetical protein